VIKVLVMQELSKNIVVKIES